MSLKTSFERFNRLITSLVIVAGLVAPIIAQTGQASAYNQPTKFSQNTLRIKLKNTSGLNAAGQSFSGGNSTSTNRLNGVLNGIGRIRKVNKFHNNSYRNSADTSVSNALNNYYTVNFNSNVDMNKAVQALQNSGLVDAAYPQVLPAPAPSSPSFASLQDYLNAAPVGADSNYASTVAGGNGSNVKIVDIEYSWNTAHEDLSRASGALVPHGTPADPYNSNDHGTAVLGELEASNNGIGVTGAANGAQLALINAYSNEYGYDLAGALSSAAAISQPGDVIQIEQQAYGPNSQFLPVEWIPEVYDAIKALTTSGRIVVEPAANGSQNLDDSTLYGASFPLGKADSGAIMVGAGENCTNASPSLSRLAFSNYGSRVNLQGPGDCVVTSGYGYLYSSGGVNAYYTQNFNGTSSATPVVTAAAADLSSVYKTLNNNAVLTPVQVRSILMQNATPQSNAVGALTGNIGPYPDLRKAIAAITPVVTPPVPTPPPKDTTPPSIPGSFSVSQTSTKPPKVTLKWAASTDNVKVVTYRIYKNGALYKTITASTLSFVDTSGLTKGHTNIYYIRAVDAAGNVSAATATKSVTIH